MSYTAFFLVRSIRCQFKRLRSHIILVCVGMNTKGPKQTATDNQCQRKDDPHACLSTLPMTKQNLNDLERILFVLVPVVFFFWFDRCIVFYIYYYIFPRDYKRSCFKYRWLLARWVVRPFINQYPRICFVCPYRM